MSRIKKELVTFNKSTFNPFTNKKEDIPTLSANKCMEIINKYEAQIVRLKRGTQLATHKIKYNFKGKPRAIKVIVTEPKKVEIVSKNEFEKILKNENKKLEQRQNDLVNAIIQMVADAKYNCSENDNYANYLDMTNLKNVVSELDDNQKEINSYNYRKRFLSK